MGGEIPPHIAVQLLHISMRLDRFDGDTVALSEALRILDDTIEDVEFKILPLEEIEDAKRNMIELAKAGKVRIPKKFAHLVECLKNFRLGTPWEELVPSMRSFIGALWAMKKYPNQSTVVIAQIPQKMKKSNVIELAKSRLLRHQDVFEQ